MSQHKKPKSFEAYISRARSYYKEQFDDSELALKFVEYFESQDRICVDWYGESVRGYVGVTTGWRPAFILLLKANSLGGSIILTNETEVIYTMELVGGKWKIKNWCNLELKQ